MRNIALVMLLLTSLLSLQGCESQICCVTPPIESQFEGKWELFKVSNGFAQVNLEGDEIGYVETIAFNTSSSTSKFERKRNGKSELVSKFEIGKELDQNAIILIDDNSYHWYTFIEKNGVEVLSLYQNAPLGAELADGSNYEYKRVSE